MLLLCSQVVQLGEQLAAAQETVKMTGQPHSFLLQQLQAAKRAKEQLEGQVASLQVTLEVRVGGAGVCSVCVLWAKEQLEATLEERVCVWGG